MDSYLSLIQKGNLTTSTAHHPHFELLAITPPAHLVSLFNQIMIDWSYNLSKDNLWRYNKGVLDRSICLLLWETFILIIHFPNLISQIIILKFTLILEGNLIHCIFISNLKSILFTDFVTSLYSYIEMRSIKTSLAVKVTTKFDYHSNHRTIMFLTVKTSQNTNSSQYGWYVVTCCFTRLIQTQVNLNKHN